MEDTLCLNFSIAFGVSSITQLSDSGILMVLVKVAAHLIFKMHGYLLFTCDFFFLHNWSTNACRSIKSYQLHQNFWEWSLDICIFLSCFGGSGAQRGLRATVCDERYCCSNPTERDQTRDFIYQLNVSSQPRMPFLPSAF